MATTTYLALVKAEYDYAATTDEEISISEDQVLYVLEYTDDEWWKVRVKQAPSEGFSPEDAPTGLVPASYVTPCEPLRQVTALYDYEATSDEEISIKEDNVYDLYEMDGDWTLVGARDAKEVGYAPTSYLEDNGDAPATNGHSEASAPAAIPAPPPAPPLPTGPAATTSSSTATPRKTNGVTSDKVLTWSNVTELEGKKKKKGTLGVGNGSLFFASDSDKAPVQKKDLSILKDITTEKSKSIKLYFTNGELLQFTVPKDDLEAITSKIESSREFAQNGGAAQNAGAEEEEEEDTYVPPPPPPPPTAGGAKGFGFLPPPPRRMVSSDSEDSDDDDGDREPPRGSAGSAAIPAAPPPPPAPPAAVPQAPRAPVIPVAPPAPPAAASRAPPAAAAAAPSGKRAKAEYDFTASEPEELSLNEGETLYVLDDSAEDWWKVRNERGEEGEVPASYVELLEDSAAGPSAATGPSAVDEDADEEAARRLQEEEKAEARREKERLRLKKLEEEARGLGAFDFQPPPARKSTASSGADTAAAARAVAATSPSATSPPPPPPPPPAPPAAAAASSPPPRAAPGRQDSQDAVREQRRERHRQRELAREKERAAQAQAQAASPVEKTKPSPARVRTWVDRTGAFKVDAEFVGLSGAKNEKIRLHKLNGVVIEVPLDKMSQEDIRLVEHMMRKRLASSSGGGDADRRHSHRSDRDRRDRPRESEQGQQQPQHRARPPSSIVASGAGGKRVTMAPGSGGGRKDQTDWFEWFLNAGCDIDDCERYARNFEKDRIDVDIVGDLEASTLRNLGLREGDIIRVRKYIAKKTGGSASGPASATTASSSAQRGPPPPDKDASPDREQQLHDDEELARKLQEEMNAGRDGSGLFTSASGGVKNTRRGRPQPKTAPSAASFDSIASSLSGIDRTATPGSERVRSPDTTKESSRRPSSTAPASSGFDDDAWTVKPSPSRASAPSPVLIDASSSASSSARATPSPAPVVNKDLTGLRAQTASPAAMPSSSKESSSAQALTDAYLDSIGLGKRAVTDYGSGHPARQTASPAPPPAPPAPQPPQQQQPQQQPQQQQPQQTGYAPQNQGVSPQQTGYYQQQQNNGPRAPPQPIPLNQQLLNPLIPTQTGMTGFIPTRNQQSPMPMMPQQTSFQQPMQTGFPGQSPFGNQFAVPMMQQQQPQQYGGMMQAQPTGFPITQQMSHMSMQPTGMPYQATPSPQPQMHIPQAPPPPPMPQQQQPQQTSSSQSSSASDFQPANVFAKMKAGEFAKPASSSQPQQKYDALRPQQTSFGGMGGGYGQQAMQPQPTGFPQQQQMQPLQAQPTGFAPGGYINMPQQQPNMNMMYPQQTGYPYRPY